MGRGVGGLAAYGGSLAGYRAFRGALRADIPGNGEGHERRSILSDENQPPTMSRHVDLRASRSSRGYGF